MIALWDSDSRVRVVLALFMGWWDIAVRTCYEVSHSAITGRGLHIAPFCCLIAIVYNLWPMVQEIYMLNVIIGTILFWLCPFDQISDFCALVAVLRSQTIYFAPHTIQLVTLAPGLLPTMLPYSSKLLENLDKMGPLIGKTLEHIDHVLPVIPGLLENIDYLVPLVDLLVPYFDKIAPHSVTLFAHFELIIPHVEKVAAHADALMPFLDKEGWEAVIPYVDYVAPHIDNIAPYAHILLQDEVYEKVIDKVPVLAPYIGNLVPVIDQLAPLLPELVVYIDLIPLSVQREFLKSKSACRTLPALVKTIPFIGKNKDKNNASIDVAPKPAYPMPSIIGFKVNFAEKQVVEGKSIAVFYKVSMTSGGSRRLRYSTLRSFHKRLSKNVSERANLISGSNGFKNVKIPKFPDKSAFGRNLSSKEVEVRRQQLDDYLQGLADIPLLLHLPVFQTFVQSFVVASMVPPDFFKLIDDL